MSRKLVQSTINGLLVDFISKPNGDIVCLRCIECNKFIAKAWEHFYCPHCDFSFMDGVPASKLREAEKLINFIEDIHEIGF